MSFLDEAIDAHTRWKIRLLAAVNGDEIPDRAAVAVDHQCDLGKWIYGEGGRAHGSKPEFVALRDVHKRFHASVAGVVDLLNAGKKSVAKDAILTGDFSARSSDVIRAIGVLKRLVA